MLRETVEIFKEIQATSSRTSKEDILRKHKDNEEFKYILEFLFNPFKLTGIKTKKLVKYANFTSDKVRQFADIYEAIEYISKNNTGRDEDVMAIANFINTYDTDIQSPVHDFLQDFFTKSFKCGITSSTINKIYGKNYIPKFEVLLAKKYEDEQHKIKGEFAVTLKVDGIRCVAIKENGSISFFTRQGQPIEDMVELIEDFKNLPDDMVYDGELLLVNDSDLSSDDLFRATQKVVRKDGIKKNIEFIMFDLLPVDEFKAGKSKKVHADRLLDLIEGLNLSNAKFIKKVPVLYTGKDKNKIYELLDKVVADGKEGLMVNLNEYYVTKRSSSLLKVKKFHTFDGLITGVYEGTGKNKGKLGGINITYKNLIVNCGSGFTDSEREAYWNDPNGIIGKVGECKFFEESTNQNGGRDLRFCTWVGLRFDKEKADVNYE